MYRLLFPILALLALLMPGTAAARDVPIVRGTVEALEFVTETTLPMAGARLSLCHYTTTDTLYGLGVWTVSQGYVLSDAGCQGGSFFDDPQRIAAGFANGQIPAGTPETARFTAMQVMTGFTIPLGVAALLGLLVLRRLLSLVGRRRPRAIDRMEVLGLEDGPTFRFIDLMLHAANADGRAQPEELAYIKEKAKAVSGLDYEDAHIEWAITHTDRIKSRRDFRRFGEGLSVEQKRVMLRGALAVLAADHHMSRTERGFVANLTQALGLLREDVDNILLSDAPARS